MSWTAHLLQEVTFLPHVRIIAKKVESNWRLRPINLCFHTRLSIGCLGSKRLELARKSIFLLQMVFEQVHTPSYIAYVLCLQAQDVVDTSHISIYIGPWSIHAVQMYHFFLYKLNHHVNVLAMRRDELLLF